MSTPPKMDLRLRRVTESDLPILFRQQCDSDARKMAAMPGRDREAFMAHWAKTLADNTVSARTILLNEVVAGNVSWNKDHKRLVGYWIGKDYWGKSVATKALFAFLGVETSRPLYAYVAKHNLGSIRVLEKCGFTICVEETKFIGMPSDGVEELVMKLSPEALIADSPPPTPRAPARRRRASWR